MLRLQSLAVSLALCALVFGSACGAAQNRPVVVASFPAQGQVLPGILAAAKVTFDDPVRILNPFGVLVAGGGVEIPAQLVQLPGEPFSVRVVPQSGFAFVPEAVHTVNLIQSAVVNDEEHYRLDPFVWQFRLGPSPSLAMGSLGAVTLLDPETFAFESSTPTPDGGQTPRAIVTTNDGATNRVWVQLSDGGGAGASLATFVPGAGAMTPVGLTTSGGGDLVVSARAMVFGRGRPTLFVAFRDTGLDRVTLHRVDTRTATETGYLVLSQPASATTAPQGMTLDLEGDTLYVSCAGDDPDTLVSVDVFAMTEIDHDPAPGPQGILLGVPAGSLANTPSFVLMTSVMREFVRIEKANDDVDTDAPPAGLAPATETIRIFVTRDARLSVETLAAGVPADLGLIGRLSGNGFASPTFVPLSDDVAGVSSGATSIPAGARLPSGDVFVFVLDNAVLTRWIDTGATFVQEDLDPFIPGIQGVDISGSVTGVTAVGSAQGVLPPP